MSNTYRTEYWRESISVALADMGIPITDDQLAALTESLVNSAENEHLAYGGQIENPLKAELAELAAKREEDANRYARNLREVEGTVEQLHWDIRRLKRENEGLRHPFPPRY